MLSLLLALCVPRADAASLADLSAGDLVISEVMADPLQVSYARGQWFEIYNSSGTEVDLDGLEVSDASGVAFTVSGTLSVAAGDYALFAVRGNSSINGGLPTVDYVYSLAAMTLSSGGDTISIGDGTTTFDSITYSPSAGYPDEQGSAMAVDPDDLTASANDAAGGWCAPESTYGDGDYGTPGAANDACPVSLSSLVAGELLITEIMSRPSAVAVYRGEWLEIYNNSSLYVDLDGLEISDSGSDIFVVSGALPLRPGERAVFAARTNPFVNGGNTEVDYRYFWGSEMDLKENDDLILAFGATTFDEVSWSTASFPSTLGVSKNLSTDFFDESDNDSGASWCDATTSYGDGDFGTPGEENSDCDSDTDGDGFAEGDDCDDDDADVNPDADEVCGDEIDNDCDGNIDDASATDVSTFYADTDSDFYGDAANTQDACERPAFYRTNDLDCDDTDAGIGAPTTRYADGDGDGFGDLTGEAVCEDVSGYVDDSGDCDDSSADVFPGAVETCNDGIDSDCDGVDSNTCEQDLSLSAVAIVGETAGDRIGRSLGGGGDLNGDGITDLAIGARFSDRAAADAGAVFVALGPITTDLDLVDADAVLTGEAADDRAGVIISADGDLDNDGYDDLLIGAQGNDDNGTDAGAAYIVYGPVTSDLSLSSADVDLTGANAGDLFGLSLDIVGDLDGDGEADFLVGAQEQTVGSDANRGAAYLFYGTVSSGSATSSASAVLEGAAAQDFAGYTVSKAGDFDGDGTDDVWVNAYRADPVSFNEGSTYLVSGAVSGTFDLSTATVQLDGESSGDQAGQYAVAGAGDINNDGLDDVIIGAQYHDAGGVTDAGAAYVVYGTTSTGAISLSSADAKLTGAATQDFAGRSIAAAGDVNSDGFADFIVGAKKDDINGTDSGAAYLIFGPATGSALLSSDVIFYGAAGDEAGIDVGSAGDLDNDGSSDLLVGAYFNDNNGTDAGAAYLIFGGGY